MNPGLALVGSYWRIGLRRISPLLMFAYLAVLLVISQMDAVVDWAYLRSALLVSDPIQRASLTVFVVALWSLSCAPAIRQLWRDPGHLWLLRQPLSVAWYGLAWVLVSVLAWLPVLGWIVVSEPASFTGLLNALSVLFAATSLMIFAAIGQWIPAGLSVAALSVSGLAAHSGVGVNGLVLAIYLASLPSLGRRGRVAFLAAAVPATFGMIPRGPVTAALARDLLLVWKLRAVYGPAAITLVCSGFMLALVRNGGLVGSQALLAASILLAIAVWPVFESLERVQIHLGPERYLPRSWPLSDQQRLRALFGLVACLSGPAVLLLTAVAGAAMGVHLMYFLANVLALIACTVFFLLARQRWYTHSSSIGAYLLAVIGLTISVSIAPASALLWALCAGLLSLYLLRRVLYE